MGREHVEFSSNAEHGGLPEILGGQGVSVPIDEPRQQGLPPPHDDLGTVGSHHAGTNLRDDSILDEDRSRREERGTVEHPHVSEYDGGVSAARFTSKQLSATSRRGSAAV